MNFNLFEIGEKYKVKINKINIIKYFIIKIKKNK